MIRPPTPDEWTALQQVEPTPESVRLARELSGHTQAAAGSTVYSEGRAWRRWEAGERSMHPALWELYRIKALGFVPAPKSA